MKALFLVPVLMALQAVPSFARMGGLDCRGPSARDGVSIMFTGARYMDMISVQLDQRDASDLIHPADRQLETRDNNLFLNVAVGTCKRSTDPGVLVECRTRKQDVSFGRFSYTKQEAPVDGFSRTVHMARMIGADDVVLRVLKKGNQPQIELSATLSDDNNKQTIQFELNKALGVGDGLFHCDLGNEE